MPTAGGFSTAFKQDRSRRLAGRAAAPYSLDESGPRADEHARRHLATGTIAGLSKPKRRKADEWAKYLTNKADHLDYPTALTADWPIAIAVIEGTC